MWEKTEKILLPILVAAMTAAVSLASVYLGNYLSLHNSESLFKLQQQTELRQRSYAKLMGLKVAWHQVRRSHAEKSLETQLMEAQYRNITQSPIDLQLHNKLADETNQLIVRDAEIRREVFETLGDIRVAYRDDPTLEPLIQAIYNHRSTVVNSPVISAIRTEQQLTTAREEAKKEIQTILRRDIEEPIDALLSALLRILRGS
jgi:polynucleotide 5'-kinase involved in rRNA processing